MGVRVGLVVAVPLQAEPVRPVVQLGRLDEPGRCQAVAELVEEGGLFPPRVGEDFEGLPHLLEVGAHRLADVPDACVWYFAVGCVVTHQRLDGIWSDLGGEVEGVVDDADVAVEPEGFVEVVEGVEERGDFVPRRGP